MDCGRILERVVRTPDEYYLPIDDARARRILGCSIGELETLWKAYDSQRSRFDIFDVWNIGLNSGMGKSKPEREILYLSHLYQRTDWLEPAQYKIALDVACPRGTRCTSSNWQRPNIPDADWVDSTAGSGVARWTAAVSRHGTKAEVSDGTILDVWHSTIDRFRFHYTHPSIAASAEATRAREVGNCTGLSAALAQFLDDAGLLARTRCGFLWGGVVGLSHEWVEVSDADGSWKVLDLSMAVLADEFFTPEYKKFCCGSLLNRVIPTAAGQASTVHHECDGSTFTTYPVVRRASTRPPVPGSVRPTDLI